MGKPRRCIQTKISENALHMFFPVGQGVSLSNFIPPCGWYYPMVSKHGINTTNKYHCGRRNYHELPAPQVLPGSWAEGDFCGGIGRFQGDLMGYCCDLFDLQGDDCYKRYTPLFLKGYTSFLDDMIQVMVPFFVDNEVQSWCALKYRTP